ncbi:MAG: carboxypeptidase regulatory-like domain-containing protein [Deltaproteobacteria bacterium]|nr:MAG: carboxypeptidase regulatory-like domain-containing protein [Deltaproteobacteria bacterium]
MRHAWLVRPLAALALAAAIAAVALAQWARRQPAHRPAAPAPGPAAAPRDAPARAMAVAARAAIAGRVIDAAGRPVAGASVRALAGGAAVAQAVTAADGAFELAGLPHGTYRIELAGAAVFPATVAAVPAPGEPLVVLAARRVAIAGVAVGAGAASEVVAVDAVGGERVARPDATGAFVLADLPEGSYTVWARDGQRVARAVVVDRFGPGPHEPVRLAFEPGAIVRGRVVDAATGRGVAARVRVVAGEGDEPPRLATADADGQFAVGPVPYGEWIVEAHAPGYVQPERLAVDSRRAPPLTIALARGGAVHGQVLDSHGVPVAGAVVWLEGEDAGGGPVVVSDATRRAERRRFARPAAGAAGVGTLVPRGELGVLLGPIPYPPPPGVRAAVPADPGASDPPAAPATGGLVTDADGRWRIDGLAAGRYRAHIRHPAFAPARTAPVGVALGAEVGPVIARLAPGTVVSGRVVDAGGHPVAGATVRADAVDRDRRLAVAVTDAGGQFRLRPIAEAARVRVTAPGFAPWNAAVAPVPQAEAASERRLEVVLERADARLAGRVVDPLGRPAAGAVVRAAGRTATADAAGRFSLDGLPRGPVDVVVSHPGYPDAAARADPGDDVTLRVSPGGGATLDVRDAHTGSPIRAAEAVAVGPGDRRRVVRVAGGTATVAPVVPGAWSVTVRAAGYVPRTVRVDIPAGDGPMAITARDVRVELERGATVAGVVRDAHGQRVAGATVRVGDVTAQTDADGRFRLRDVPTGDVAVEARKGRARGAVRVPLRPGDELVTLEISLSAVPPDGAP